MSNPLQCSSSGWPPYTSPRSISERSLILGAQAECLTSAPRTLFGDWKQGVWRDSSILRWLVSGSQCRRGWVHTVTTRNIYGKFSWWLQSSWSPVVVGCPQSLCFFVLLNRFSRFSPGPLWQGKVILYHKLKSTYWYSQNYVLHTLYLKNNQNFFESNHLFLINNFSVDKY